MRLHYYAEIQDEDGRIVHQLCGGDISEIVALLAATTTRLVRAQVQAVERDGCICCHGQGPRTFTVHHDYTDQWRRQLAAERRHRVPQEG